ncbi:MAG: peptidase S8 [Solirubrobacteraceae bacterium]
MGVQTTGATAGRTSRAWILATALALAALALPAFASAAPTRPGFEGVSDTRSAEQPHWACPHGLCDAIVDPAPTGGSARRPAVFASHKPEGGGEEGGIDPEELRAAYGIPTSGGAGQTIAVVEGFAYKQAEKDLVKYRSHYGLPPCTAKSGCLSIVNGHGAPPTYERFVNGWEPEVALDLDMASTACPECHLLVVDAEEEDWDALGQAVDEAAALGATEISNSYGLPEETCAAECAEAAPDWNHPGLFVSVSSGDYGYDNAYEGAVSPSFPADQPEVAAIGGTALRHAHGARGFAERVWGERSLGLGTGSGCTAWPKPVWQKDSGCAGRTDNDVAAVGACSTPVSVYDSTEGGWIDLCGTSVSSPLVAGIEAHASPYARSLPGGEAFYEGASLFDVKSGSNGTCPVRYLCHGEKGYDGPSGNGTPDGPLLLEP